MPQKFVQIDAYVEWPTGTPRSDQFFSFNLESVRAEVEASVFGNKHDKVDKGTFGNSLSAGVRPDADWVFMTTLLEQLEADDDVPILYRPKAGAKASDNPEMTFSVAVTKAPPLGTDRGSLIEGNLQFHVNTAITYDNGTVTVTLG